MNRIADKRERNFMITCTEAHHPDHVHQHGPNCGHTAFRHDAHVEYLHSGHLHYMHGRNSSASSRMPMSNNVLATTIASSTRMPIEKISAKRLTRLIV